ncbi:MAG: hypothetical protein JWN17_1213 [Frankiales bacterium]|nr:hypothetical protein [Frankiales bacterium]
MRYQGYNGQVRLEGDDLVIDRTDVKGRFGGDVVRRVPLDDVVGARLEPAPEPRKPGYLQLVLAGGPDEELSRAQAIVSPDVVTFSAKQQPAFERLWDWLENGGDLQEEDPAEAPTPAPATAPAPAVPTAEPVPAAPSAAGPVDPFAPTYRGPGSSPDAGDDPSGSAAPGYGPPPGATASYASSAYASSAYAPSPDGGGAGSPGGRPGLADAVRSGLRQYVVFAGRARRAEYWWFVLGASLAYVVAVVLDAAIGTTLFTPVALLGLFLPTLSVLVRRLHDTGRTGWWYLVALVPLVGSIVLLVFLTRDSDPGANAYGPSPKQPQLL